MQEEINLLSANKKKSPIKRGIFFNAALGFLLITIAISVLITFINITLTAKYDSLVAQQNDVVDTTLTAELNSRRARLQTIHDRVASIKKFAPSNAKMDNRLKLILDIIPPGVDVLSFQIDKSTIETAVSSGNLALIDSFFDSNLQKQLKAKNSDIAKIIIESFTIDKTSLTYRTNVKFSFNNSL